MLYTLGWSDLAFLAIFEIGHSDLKINIFYLQAIIYNFKEQSPKKKIKN